MARASSALHAACRALCALLLAHAVLRAQESFPRTDLNWQTLTTPHFLIHFHDGNDRAAREAAEIAEAIHGPITELYGHAPDGRVSIVLRDHDDYSNGAAYFYDNKIEIWVPALDFELRGTHPWLRNVITHEYTHIIQMQTSFKWTRRVPAVYLQWLGYEAERRPDVLYGYPNVLVSYPVSGFVVPSWFAEGTAQYNHPDFRYDTWDAHRDMILRMHLLEGTPLSWEEMAVFGKTSLGNESSYNAGFSIVEYIARTYGDSAVVQISKALASLPRVTIDGAVEAALGMSGQELYRQWLAERRSAYQKVQEEIAPTRTEGHLIAADGFGNFSPVFSPDGRIIYYTSNAGEDYFGLSRLMAYDRATGTKRRVRDGVRSTLAVSPEGRFIYYARTTRANPRWASISDLYRFDLVEEEETRLTHGWRAFSPALSPDGRTLAFAVANNGTLNIAVADVDGRNMRRLTSFDRGEQVFTPAWSSDGTRITFGYAEGHGQTLATVDTSGTSLTFIAFTGDARNPRYSRDGRWLYFAWDTLGRYNIWRMSLSGGRLEQVTQVLGGAFQPAVDDSGNLAFARYDATGYKIALLPPPSVKAPKIMFERGASSVIPNGTLLDTNATQVLIRLPAGAACPTTSFRRAAQAGNLAVGPAAQSDIPNTFLSEDHVKNGFGMTKESEPLVIPNDALLAQNLSQKASIQNLDSRPNWSDTLVAKRYRSVFTDLSLVPVLRVDNYNTRNRGIDMLKPGLYFVSSEMLDKLSMFGGAAINRELERDLFLVLEYRDKLPILSAIGLEPTATVELYNITRVAETSFPLYVRDLQEYEIPVDITYDLLEFDATLTQPIGTEHTRLTLGYTRSRYEASLGSFIIPTVGVQQAFRNVYLIGTNLWLQGVHRDIHPTVDAAINPVGRSVSFRYTYENNDYNRDLEYDVQNGMLVPRYLPYRFHRWELNWAEHLRMPFDRHTLSLSARGGVITGGAADTIFHFYAGGLVGLKGYPFYAIEGTRVLQLSGAYRFPLATALDARFLQFYFTKLYASIFAEVGDAWTGGSSAARWRKDAGLELRLEAFSFYSYPTRISLAGAYGFDRFTRQIQGERITYGKEWRFYLSILFDFNFGEPIARGVQGMRWK